MTAASAFLPRKHAYRAGLCGRLRDRCADCVRGQSPPSPTQTVVELVRGFATNFLAVRAARHLHNGMLARLLRCGPPWTLRPTPRDCGADCWALLQTSGRSYRAGGVATSWRKPAVFLQEVDWLAAAASACI